MTEIVLASGNPRKLRELSGALAGVAVKLVAQSDFGVSAAEECGRSFIENAIHKARHAARWAARPAIADDSGIVVDALAGAPGIFSARYAGGGATDQQNLDKLLYAMRDAPDERRTCRFVCVVAFLEHVDDPMPIICEGIWEGRLLRAPRGANGFGYDPVFYVPERGCAAAELEPEVKNMLSHRGKALRLLARRLAAYLDDE